MRLNTLVKSFGCVLASVLLLGCGGGGGDAGSSAFTPTTSGGTTTTVAPTAADILITLDSTSLSNSGTNTVAVTITAVNASRVALANVPVSIAVDNNAVVVVSGTATGTDGKLTASVQTGTDRSNRIVTVTAASGSIQKSASFSIIGTKIDASVLQAVLAPGASGQIQYRLTDVNSNPMTGLPIVVTGPGVTSASATTDTNGSYAFNYVAPTTAGTLTITANAGGVTSVQTVIVQSGVGTIPAVSTPILSADVKANPSVVSVNSTSSNNRSEVRAQFLGAGNAPLANVRVRFDLNGDVNSIGGTVSSGSNVVYSDANGLATTSYIPGARQSPTDGVTIRACYYVNDSDATAGACAASALTHLTVNSEPLAISIGTDNTIADGANGLAYIKKYVVLVVDSAGQAKAGVQITPSIDLIAYAKGFYVTPSAWTRSRTAGGYLSVSCLNEDVNRNGVLELAEDSNGNGQLDPRKSDVAISMIGTGITDSSGVATLQILYPKNVATWVNYKILVTAGVSGTEGRATWSDTLGAAASEFTALTPPSFVVSPYGVGDPSRSAAEECTKPN